MRHKPHGPLVYLLEAYKRVNQLRQALECLRQTEAGKDSIMLEEMIHDAELFERRLRDILMAMGQHLMDDPPA